MNNTPSVLITVKLIVAGTSNARNVTNQSDQTIISAIIEPIDESTFTNSEIIFSDSAATSIQRTLANQSNTDLNSTTYMVSQH